MKRFSLISVAQFAGMRLPVGKLLFVDQTNGVDPASTGDLTKGVRSTPRAFKTITAAKTAALSGDTIIVHPGNYDEFDLAKNGVNLHFINGAKIIRTNAALSAVAIFDDNGGSTMSFKVTGEGSFESAAAPVLRFQGTAPDCVLKGLSARSTGSKTVEINQSGTDGITLDFGKISNTGAFKCIGIGYTGAVPFDIRANEITGEGGQAFEFVAGSGNVRCPKVTGVGIAVSNVDAVVTFWNANIGGSTYAVWVSGSGELRLVGCKLFTTSTTTAAISIKPPAGLILKGCTIVAGTSAAASIVPETGTPSVKIYGGCEANKAVHASVTQLVGTILVSASVT